MKTLLSRGLVLLIFLSAAILAWRENRKPERPAPVQVSLTGDTGGDTGPPAVPESDYKNSIALFTYILFMAVTAGVVVLKWVVPAVGDRVAESFYSAPDHAEQTETQKAMALISQGEYHKAITALQRIAEDNPRDRFAVTEAAKIYQDKLGDLDAAVEVLEKAAARDWPEDDKCFLLLKLADLHATQRCDFTRARTLLEQITGSYTGSRHAMMGQQKLQEIEEQEFIARRQQGGAV
jgi:tetratricopeptide (TPR) repeat protein